MYDKVVSYIKIIMSSCASMFKILIFIPRGIIYNLCLTGSMLEVKIFNHKALALLNHSSILNSILCSS